jgi:putative ABC transport system permease protein
MYILQNALKNVARNRGRNILLAAILFTIIAATVVTLMINNTSDRIITEYKNQFGLEVTISRNMPKYFAAGQRGQQIPEISPAQYVAFSESDLIQKSILTNSASCSSDTLTAVGQTGSGIQGSGYVSSPNIMLQGNSWADFTNGYRAVVDGEMPEKKYECIVDTDFAELNGISVGDTIRLNGMVLLQDEGRVDPTAYNLVVTGIYLSTEDVDKDAVPWAGSLVNRHNEVLTVFDTIDNTSAGVAITATYYLKNPSYLQDINSELRAKGLDSMFDVTIDEDTYNAVVDPVEGMRGISMTFMIIVLILGAVILILLSSIAVRERKYEIGVLRAMGMKKAKVALGLWSEMVFITMFCLIVGIGAGALIAQPVSDTLLSQQIENAQKIKDMGGGFFSKEIGGASKTVDDDPIAEVNVKLGIDTILELVVISLLLASVAGLAAISKITKYEPIKILMERN